MTDVFGIPQNRNQPPSPNSYPVEPAATYKEDYNSEFFSTLRERYDFGIAHDREDRKSAEADTLFAAGEQWSTAARASRNMPGKERPCLTENRLAIHIAQVVNDCRENKPAIQITPMDGGSSETALMLQSRIRQIEYESDADIAYDTSAEQQITCGRGFYRITTRERFNPTTGEYDQFPSIEPIENQFSVIIDPSSRKYDRSDAEWMFIVRTMSKDEAKRKWGDKTVMAMTNFFAIGTNPAPSWIGLGQNNDQVIIAEYWYKEYDSENRFKVKQCVTNGVETLEETEWIGSSIPIPPVWGREMMVNGERRTYSLIRFAHDPQRLLNLYVSNIAEMVAQMPKTPFIGAEGFMLGREDEWNSINNIPQAALQYAMVYDRNGNAAQPPQRITSEPPIQALVAGYLQAADAIKAATGIFDAGLGARSNETSGLAINSRKKESDVANFHFSDNQARSRKYAGKILLELIRILDGDKPKQVPIRHEDGTVEMVWVNQPAIDKNGNGYHHDLSAGLYDVAVSTGPSYTSGRQEENQRLAAIFQTAPELLMVLGDKFFETSDTPGAKGMAERMKRFIDMKNPGLIDKPQGKIDPAKIQQQMAQMGQMIDHLTKENQTAQQIIETRQTEAASKERIAQMQEQNKREIAELQEATKLQLAEINAKVQTAARSTADQIEIFKSHQEMAHELALAKEQMQHQKDLQAAQAQAMIAQQQAAQQPPPQQDQNHQQQPPPQTDESEAGPQPAVDEQETPEQPPQG